MKAFLTEKAHDSGFIAIGFSRPERPLFFEEFTCHISDNKHGDMKWLGRYLDIRENPGKLLDGCRTVISLAYPYSSYKPVTPEGFSSARYTEGLREDYHSRVKKKCRSFVNDLLLMFPGNKARICVDSAPLMERSFAYSSGIGFFGKNNSIIIPGYGSYFYLAEILTTLYIPESMQISMETQCGSCSRCIDACPANALEDAYRLNGSKCLSYLSIEMKGDIDDDTASRMGSCFFGCDICQEVCPFNQNANQTVQSLPSVTDISGMTEEDFLVKFGNTAFARSGFEKIRNNIFMLESHLKRQLNGNCAKPELDNADITV